MFQVCFKKGYFKNVSRVFSGFQGYLKEVQKKFKRSFKGVLRIFQGSFRCVQRKLLECFKEISMED